MRPEDEQVRSMRTLLNDARIGNSRMTAAAIGGHLSKITRDAGRHSSLDVASDRVRDASLHFLKALHQDHDVQTARVGALRSLEALEAAMPSDVVEPAEERRRPLAGIGRKARQTALASKMLKRLRSLR